MTTKVTIISDAAGLQRIAGDWRTLHDAAGGGPFSSMEWIEAWLAAWRDTGASPLFACARRDGQLVAAMPLGRRWGPVSSRGPWVRRLEMLCDQRAGFHDILLAPGHEDALPHILGALRAQRGWAVIDLTPLSRTESTAALAEAALSGGLSCRRRFEIATVLCDHPDGWEDYLARRSRDFRKSLRRGHRALEGTRHGFHVARGDTPGDDALLSRIMALSARCWKARMGTDIGSEARIRCFMSALWSRLSKRGAMTLHLLEVDGRDAASCLTLDQGPTSYGMISDFDEAFQGISPGRLIVAAAIRDAARRGLRHTDLLRSTPFTERFADRHSGFDRLRICRRFGLVDGWLAAEDRLRHIGRDARRKRQLATRKRVAHKD